MGASTGPLLPLVLLLAVPVSLNVAQQQQRPYRPLASESPEWLDEPLRSLLPINVVRRLSDTSANGSTRTASEGCSREVELLQEELRNGTMWALKMIDASSKIPSGMLMGNKEDLGMYDECVGINAVVSGQEIRGHQCAYAVSVNWKENKLTETLAICTPASCSPDDIKGALDDAVEMLVELVDVDASVTGVACSAVLPREWTAGGIVTLVGFSALLLFLVACTVYDVFLMFSKVNVRPESRLAAIRKFSLYSNAVRVLSTKVTPQTLPAIQGLRFFSMCWVILGHVYFMHMYTLTINFIDVVEWLSSWESLLITPGPFAVDTFFTISGFLMSYLFLKELSTGRSFNLIAYYVHRYLRLTPAFAALLLIAIFILPRLGSGPLWESNTLAEEDECRQSWWSMLLYIHNYVNKSGCLAHTWYLAAEMHYFWLSPFILYPLSKKPKIGLAILAACFVGSIVAAAKITYDNEYTSALFPNGEMKRTLDTLANFYTQSHVRAAPWLIGAFFGYLVHINAGATRKVTKWIGWLLAIVAFGFCIFGTRKLQMKDYEYDRVWETFYAAVARPTWAAAVAWVIYASVLGFGGPVTRILSFSIFYPLSRLSYCVYLVHFVIQTSKARAVRAPRFFSNFTAFDSFLSDLMLSIIIGFFISLFFESPVLVLEKLVKKWSRRKPVESRKKTKDEKIEIGIEDPHPR